jgi:elongation factor 1-beta
MALDLRKSIILPNLLVRVKIMPREAEIKPPTILEELSKKHPEIQVRSSKEEPVAFGLVALIADFMTDDEAGAMEKIEEAMRSLDSVGEFEVLGASRISAKVGK